MSILVVTEYDNATLKASTRNTLSAATLAGVAKVKMVDYGLVGDMFEVVLQLTAAL